MAGPCDPRCSVDVRSYVALGGHVRRSGVDSHAHADWSSLEHLLRFSRGGNGAGCGWKGDEERIALRIHLDAVVSSERLAKRPTVLHQRLCVVGGAQLLQEPRRTLDIGEEKRDGSGGKVAGHRPIQAPPQPRCRPGAITMHQITLQKVTTCLPMGC